MIMVWNIQKIKVKPCEGKCRCLVWDVDENNICNICGLEGCDE